MSEANPHFDPSRFGLLFFSRGRGRGHAIPDIAIAEELLRMRDDVDVRFVSYGTGADTFTEFGHTIIDLDLPERTPILETLVRAGHMIGWLQPQLIVAHEEFAVPPAARIFGVPTVFITDWFSDFEDFIMRCVGYADEVLFIDEPGVFPEPPYLQGKVKYVGPVLREFTYSSSDRKRARRELGIDPNATLISVIVPPGRRVERVAPIMDEMIAAFDSLRVQDKLLIWLAGEDYSSLRRRKAVRGRQDIVVMRSDSPFDRLMVASDLAITKGNRNIVLELASLGVPSISITHGLNRIDDLRTSKIPTNLTVKADQLTAARLAEFMTQMIVSGRARKPAKLRDGTLEAARQIANLLA